MAISFRSSYHLPLRNSPQNDIHLHRFPWECKTKRAQHHNTVSCDPKTSLPISTGFDNKSISYHPFSSSLITKENIILTLFFRPSTSKTESIPSRYISLPGGYFIGHLVYNIPLLDCRHMYSYAKSRTLCRFAMNALFMYLKQKSHMWSTSNWLYSSG